MRAALARDDHFRRRHRLAVDGDRQELVERDPGRVGDRDLEHRVKRLLDFYLELGSDMTAARVVHALSMSDPRPAEQDPVADQPDRHLAERASPLHAQALDGLAGGEVPAVAVRGAPDDPAADLAVGQLLTQVRALVLDRGEGASGPHDQHGGAVQVRHQPVVAQVGEAADIDPARVGLVRVAGLSACTAGSRQTAGRAAAGGLRNLQVMSVSSFPRG